MLKLDEKAHKVMEASRNLRNSSSRGRGFEGPVPQGILKKSDCSEAVLCDRSAAGKFHDWVAQFLRIGERALCDAKKDVPGTDPA